MTNSDQQGQPSNENEGKLEGSGEPAGRSSRFREKSRPPWYRSKGGWFWIGVSVLALGGLSAALIPVAIGGSHQTASTGQAASTGSSVPGAANGTTTTSGGTGPNGTSRAKGEVISAAKLAENGGALSLPENLESQVISWQSGPAGTQLRAVSSGLGNALQAAGVRQYSPMKHACAQLAASVATAKAGPQIPDAAMQELYAKALSELAKGAADCRTAISLAASGDETVQAHLDTALLNQSVSELSAGATDIFRSTAEIEIVTREHH